MELEGFGILVNDIDLMVDFYIEKLGFDIKFKKGEDNVYLIKDGTLFLMYGRNDFENMTKRAFSYPKELNGTFEIALKVKNYNEVDVVYNDLISKGVKSVMEPKTMPWGQRTSYIADPEGNLIEIGSFIK